MAIRCTRAGNILIRMLIPICAGFIIGAAIGRYANFDKSTELQQDMHTAIGMGIGACTGIFVAAIYGTYQIHKKYFGQIELDELSPLNDRTVNGYTAYQSNIEGNIFDDSSFPSKTYYIL